jgi:hypothetical protein
MCDELQHIITFSAQSSRMRMHAHTIHCHYDTLLSCQNYINARANFAHRKHTLFSSCANCAPYTLVLCDEVEASQAR